MYKSTCTKMSLEGDPTLSAADRDLPWEGQTRELGTDRREESQGNSTLYDVNV